MSETRFVELETRLAYQDETLRVLNEVVTKQQDQIDRLISIVRALQDRVKNLPQDGEQKFSPADEVPPHY